MLSQGIFLVVIISYIDLNVKGQSVVPVEISIPDSENMFSGLLEIKCRFPLEAARLSAIWWRYGAEDDILFFQHKDGPGSKLGDHGDIIADYGFTLAETPGGTSEHHIIIDATLCYDKQKFQCQVITNDEAEGTTAELLNLKAPEISLDICERNCSNLAPNSTHGISCLAKGTRHEPNITVSVSGDVISSEPMRVMEDQNSCYYETVETGEVTLDRGHRYDVTCIVQDGSEIHKVTKQIGENGNSASSVFMSSFLAAIFVLRFLL